MIYTIIMLMSLICAMGNMFMYGQEGDTFSLVVGIGNGLVVAASLVLSALKEA